MGNGDGRDEDEGGRGGGHGGDGRIKEGMKQNTPGLGKCQRIKSIIINQIGTDYSVSLYSVQGL